MIDIGIRYLFSVNTSRRIEHKVNSQDRGNLSALAMTLLANLCTDPESSYHMHARAHPKIHTFTLYLQNYRPVIDFRWTQRHLYAIPGGRSTNSTGRLKLPPDTDQLRCRYIR
ncbi:hypothetical protein [Streptomyces sediminimaris]|uniref:hypothetical protein n=1 Tax=Streptomyces sediminimaris TaxID=3383721 RepID=UPI00399BBB3E